MFIVALFDIIRQNNSYKYYIIVIRKGEIIILNFILGFFVGGFLGITIMCLFQINNDKV